MYIVVLSVMSLRLVKSATLTARVTAPPLTCIAEPTTTVHSTAAAQAHETYKIILEIVLVRFDVGTTATGPTPWSCYPRAVAGCVNSS